MKCKILLKENLIKIENNKKFENIDLNSFNISNKELCESDIIIYINNKDKMKFIKNKFGRVGEIIINN